MKKHLAAMAKEHDALKKAHETAAECHRELSACFKTEVAEGLRKATEKDHHEDLANCHKAMSECHGRLGDNCRKAAALPADAQGGNDRTSDVETNEGGDASAKAVTAAVDALRGDFDKRLRAIESATMPTAARGVLPAIPDGLQMVNRAGGATPPVDVAQIAPEFQKMFTD